MHSFQRSYNAKERKKRQIAGNSRDKKHNILLQKQIDGPGNTKLQDNDYLIRGSNLILIQAIKGCTVCDRTHHNERHLAVAEQKQQAVLQSQNALYP